MPILQTISGKVIRGISKGQQIGFPTINLAVPEGMDMAFGVYGARVTTPLGVYKGALHYGPRKILDIPEASLEVYLLDFSGDLYDQEVKIEVLSKIRDTQHFSNLEDLKKQIALDVEAVRKFN